MGNGLEETRGSNLVVNRIIGTGLMRGIEIKPGIERLLTNAGIRILRAVPQNGDPCSQGDCLDVFGPSETMEALAELVSIRFAHPEMIPLREWKST